MGWTPVPMRLLFAVLAVLTRGTNPSREGNEFRASPDGIRCNTRHRLQLHHWVAVAHGGLNTPDNLTIHCGPHNRYQAKLDGLPRPSREGIPRPIHQS